MTARASRALKIPKITGPRPWRIIRKHPRVFVGLLVGVAVGLALHALPSSRWAMCALGGWDMGALLYVSLTFGMMARSDVAAIRLHASSQDEGAAGILFITVASALASLLAIVFLLGKVGMGDAPKQGSDLLLATATIVLSWTLIHTIFSVHYAHEFYGDGGVGGLAFPGDEKEPDYWDFVYFALVIGMTAQVADVGIKTKVIRRTVAAHGVVSFFFNVALLALMVNIAASLM
jgi:Predicted membrane protein